MTLPRALVALVVVLTTVLVPVAVAGPVGAAEEDEAAALTVTLSRLAPATVPERGRIVLAGTVRNDSDETWAAVNVHPVLSQSPMTDREQLAAAAVTDPAIEIGTRLYQPGQFAALGDLVPGAVASFQISLRARDLPITGTPGVYWIGAHALGQNAEGRDDVADGRARTFIALTPDDARTAVSVVVPLRVRVRRDADGRLLDPSEWGRALADDGRLERIAALLTTADTRAVTMLVDPAVIDAVGSIAVDNPALSLGEPTGEEPEPPEEGPDETPAAAEPVGATGTSRSAVRFGPIDRANATRWLAQVSAVARGQTVLGLGYADPEIASLARRRPGLIETAADQSAATFERLEIGARPAVAPPSGWLDDAALPAIPEDTVVLVSDQAAPRTRTQWRTSTGQNLVFTDEKAAAGGPGPTPPYDALAVRQRILADAALRALDGRSDAMVVSLPQDWDPGAGWEEADFFGGLDQPWLDLVPVSPGSVGAPEFTAVLGYPAVERRRELSETNMAATRTLVTTAEVADEVLRSTNDVRHQLTGLALTAVSQHARRDPVRARRQVWAADTAMRDRLGRISVLGTEFVTLSGGSGTLTVTVANDLEQPVTVGMRARVSSPDVRIDTPEPLDLAPGQRAVLRLRATASSIGVHEVTLTPVTADGAELGTPLTFNLRTSQVGNLIWGVLVGGGALLLVMIVRRIRRGLVEHRWRGQ